MTNTTNWAQLFPLDRQPSLEELDRYADSPLWQSLRAYLKEAYGAEPRMEYSRCGLEPGWNVKFKKAGRTLCTIYPRETYFTVMVVVGRKEKEPVEAILSECTAQVREIYEKTREGNGQRWLMIDLEEKGDAYRDVLRLVQIRRNV